jgi:gamma-glutamyltranspeptidase/glutathione hydrolase
VSDATVAGLAALGHRVVRPEMPWGGGQAIAIDHANGTLAAASDPRRDGCALAY